MMRRPGVLRRAVLAVALGVVLRAGGGAAGGTEAYQNKKVTRVIDATAHVIRIRTEVEVGAGAGGGGGPYEICLTASEREHLAHFEVTDGDGEVVAAPPGRREGCYEARGVEAGETLAVYTTLTGVLEPFPKEVRQREKQLVLLRANAYFFSPYASASQITVISLESAVVLSHSEELQPATLRGDTLTYGPFKGLPAESEHTVTVHYQNRAPFLTFTAVHKEVEVSHWGSNVAVEELVQARRSRARAASARPAGGATERRERRSDSESGGSVGGARVRARGGALGTTRPCALSVKTATHARARHTPRHAARHQAYHSGAKLKGGFSRLDYMRQGGAPKWSFNKLLTVLPQSATGVYYRDVIGNISSSALKAPPSALCRAVLPRCAAVRRPSEPARPRPTPHVSRLAPPRRRVRRRGRRASSSSSRRASR